MTAVESLLIQGKKEEAVDEALRCQQFGLALFIGAMCQREIFFRTLDEFAINSFAPGTPFSTVAKLHSSNGACVSDTSFLGDDEALRCSWRQHLAVLISNRPAGWDKATEVLGDRLRAMGEFSAAHCCYLISGVAMERATKKTAKWTLAGCSMEYYDIALKTEASLKAFFRTEGYEWAKQRANHKAVIKSLQPYKLIYCHLLADLGFRSIAKAYLDDIIPFFDRKSKSSDDEALSSVPLGQWVALGRMDGMKESAHELSARLNGMDMVEDMDISFVTAHTHLDSAKPPTDPIQIGREGDPPVLGGPSSQADTIPSAARNSAENDGSSGVVTRNMPLDQAEPHILLQEEKPSNGVHEISPLLTTNRTSSPPQKGSHQINPSQDTPQVAPREKTQVAQPTTSASQEQKDAGTDSPRKRGIVGWLKGRLGVEEDNAVKADLGGQMEAYYDKEKKRWIFPGDDPNEEIPSLGPPPTAVAPVPQEEKKKEPQDSLSAMMAPPPTRLPRSGPNRTTLSGNKPAATMPPTAPPKFAVFKPPPS
jgi:hypothetical protein